MPAPQEKSLPSLFRQARPWMGPRGPTRHVCAFGLACAHAYNKLSAQCGTAEFCTDCFMSTEYCIRI